MSQILVIVESPTKATTIGKILGSHYHVIACNGHVRDLPKSSLGIDKENGFVPKYVTPKGKGKVLEMIRSAAKKADRILLATDPDREGEAISWHLAKLLNLDENSPCRVTFNEITPNAIKAALKKPRAIDMNLFNAQQARRVLDRLVGYEISPILWSKVRKNLSAGRVQSAALRMICDREKEINEFLPEEYWVLTAVLHKKNSRKNFEAQYIGEGDKKVKIQNADQANRVLERVKDAEFTVKKVTSDEKKRHAAPPFTTSSLQQEASRKLNFTSKRTMSVAQMLYEGVNLGKGQTGLITYMRTDSVRIAKEAQDGARKYILDRFGSEYVPSKPNFYKGGKSAQDAHEAIRPTSLANEPEAIKKFLTDEQYKLYRLIYNRFLASQMEQCTVESRTALIDANGATFKAIGSKILFDGFRRVYLEGRDDGSDEETILPDFDVNEKLIAQDTKAEQHFTQPPSRYTDATLIKTLEEKGIGRPSTYAPTVSTLVDRGYILRQKKQFTPTELGTGLNSYMCLHFPDIVDSAFTAYMEEKLDGVEEGSVEWQSMLSDFYTPFQSTVKDAKEGEAMRIADPESDVICDKCGAKMVYKLSKYGRFLACPNFPNCRNTKPIVETLPGVACPKCGGMIVKKKSAKTHKDFYGCEHFPECDFVSWDKPLSMKCPTCGSMMVQRRSKRGSYITCSNESCNYVHRGSSKNNGEEHKNE